MFSELQGFDIGLRLFADNEQKKQNFWQKHKGKILAGAALAGLGGLAYANKDKIGDAINSWRIRKFIPAGMGTVPVISETSMPKKEAKSDKGKADKQAPSTGHGASVPAQSEPAGTKDIKQSSTAEQNAPAQDKKNNPSETKPRSDEPQLVNIGKNAYQWEGLTGNVNKFAHGDTTNSKEKADYLIKLLCNISSLGTDPEGDIARCMKFKSQLEQNIKHLNRDDCWRVSQKLKSATYILHNTCKSQNTNWSWTQPPTTPNERMYNIMEYCYSFAISCWQIK